VTESQPPKQKDFKTLVTGGTGMVGHALQDLYPSATFVGTEHADLRDPKETEYLFKHCSPRYVIHLAARVGGVKGNSDYVAEFYADNSLINTNVLNAAVNVGAKRVVSMLSTCVYPDKDHVTYPLTEDQMHAGPPHESNYGYAHAKRMLEVQTRAINEQYGKKYICAIPNNIYGKCFSEDTEIMTPFGLRLIKDVQPGDTVYTLNPDTKEIEFTKVSSTQEMFSKKAINFSGKAVDFIVTDEHKIVYQKKKMMKRPAEWFRKQIGKEYGQVSLLTHSPLKSEGVGKFSMEPYVDEFHIPHTEKDKVKDHFHSKSSFFDLEYDMSDLASFVGWYVSEGSMVTQFTKGGKQSYENLETGQIRISQSKVKNHSNYLEILALLNRMNLQFGKDEKSFYFTSRLWRNFIQKEIGIITGPPLVNVHGKE